MRVMFRRAAILLLSAAAIPPSLATPSFERLEQRFAALSADVYNYATSRDESALSVSGINTLKQKADRLFSGGASFEALTLINANIGVIRDNVESPAAAGLIDHLLQHNAYVAAESVYRHADTFAPTYAVSAISYPFAKYHYDRGDWQRVIELIEGQTSDLASEDAHHSAILIGASLQHLKKHRESVKYYERVPEASRYYPYAQLNIALAYLRQDWWTDAQLALQSALKAPGMEDNDELTNRVYLVLGYLLLKEGFYRDARDAFRNIHLESRYANRALLGLGLSAIGQDDHVGALNAFSTLKEKGTHDLPSDETRVMLPYVYEKLKQQMTASAGYNDAMGYYTRQIELIGRLIEQGDFYSPDSAPAAGAATFALNDTGLVIRNAFPADVLTNLRELERFRRSVRNRHLLGRIVDLHRDYRRAYNEVVRTTLATRRDHLESYLNQSRYGLARLYDQSEAPAR